MFLVHVQEEFPLAWEEEDDSLESALYRNAKEAESRVLEEAFISLLHPLQGSPYVGYARVVRSKKSQSAVDLLLTPVDPGTPNPVTQKWPKVLPLLTILDYPEFPDIYSSNPYWAREDSELFFICRETITELLPEENLIIGK